MQPKTYHIFFDENNKINLTLLTGVKLDLLAELLTTSFSFKQEDNPLPDVVLDSSILRQRNIDKLAIAKGVI